MNHKRGRPKNARAGCLLCKPWKANGAKGSGDFARDPVSARRRTQDTGGVPEVDEVHPNEFRMYTGDVCEDSECLGDCSCCAHPC